jgi:hypothetical protein
MLRLIRFMILVELMDKKMNMCLPTEKHFLIMWFYDELLQNCQSKNSFGYTIYNHSEFK